MADLSDVCTYLYGVASAAVYPNGIGSPSVAGIDCRVIEGWPIPAQLDLDVAGQMKSTSGAPVIRPGGVVATVSIYPMQGTGVSVYQILDKTYTISPAVIGLTVSLAGNVITVSGSIAPNEYLTLVCDNQFVYSQTGASAAAMLAALAAQAHANYPSVVATSNTLTIPVGHSLVVRQGGQAIQGKVINRQRQSVMVSVWAPTHATRSLLAAALDNLIKQTIVVTMPDSSQALVTYNRTNVSDEQQAATIYRRDLIYDVEYATVEQFPAYVITSTQVSIAKPGNTAIATALT